MNIRSLLAGALTVAGVALPASPAVAQGLDSFAIAAEGTQTGSRRYASDTCPAEATELLERYNAYRKFPFTEFSEESVLYAEFSSDFEQTGDMSCAYELLKHNLQYSHLKFQESLEYARTAFRLRDYDEASQAMGAARNYAGEFESRTRLVQEFVDPEDDPADLHSMISEAYPLMRLQEVDLISYVASAMKDIVESDACAQRVHTLSWFFDRVQSVVSDDARTESFETFTDALAPCREDLERRYTNLELQRAGEVVYEFPQGALKPLGGFDAILLDIDYAGLLRRFDTPDSGEE